jgi:hypothetical protein
LGAVCSASSRRKAPSLRRYSLLAPACACVCCKGEIELASFLAAMTRVGFPLVNFGEHAGADCCAEPVQLEEAKRAVERESSNSVEYQKALSELERTTAVLASKKRRARWSKKSSGLATPWLQPAANQRRRGRMQMRRAPKHKLLNCGWQGRSCSSPRCARSSMTHHTACERWSCDTRKRPERAVRARLRSAALPSWSSRRASSVLLTSSVLGSCSAATTGS